MSQLLKPASIALASLNLLDMGITAFLLARFGTAAEANGLMRGLWEASPLLFVGFKVLLSGFFLFLAHRSDRLHQWMALAVMPAAGVYLVVVGWSFFVLFSLI